MKYVLYLCTLYYVGNIPDKQKYNYNYAMSLYFQGLYRRKSLTDHCTVPPQKADVIVGLIYTSGQETGAVSTYYYSSCWRKSYFDVQFRREAKWVFTDCIPPLANQV